MVNVNSKGKLSSIIKNEKEIEKMKTIRTREETIRSIIAYFEENEETFNAAIEELDAYNGYLNDDRYYNMEDLNEFYNDVEPLELLYRVFYGRDDDAWHTNSHGEKEYSEFNPHREYFRYSSYGNLVSTNYKDYSAHLDAYAIEAMSENVNYINTIEENEELKELFEEIEK